MFHRHKNVSSMLNYSTNSPNPKIRSTTHACRHSYYIFKMKSILISQPCHLRHHVQKKTFLPLLMENTYCLMNKKCRNNANPV